MNLKSKLVNKVTSTVKIISDTQAIVSDECSASHVSALTIVTAPDKQALWIAVKDKCVAQASATRFTLVIALINQADELTFLSAPKQVAKPTNLDEYTV